MEIEKLLQALSILKPDVPETTGKAITSPWVIGEKYQIRTVTMTLTGELIFIGDKELLLKDAAWIADTGRFSEALEDQTKYSEVEPFKENVIVGRGSIVDATKINYLERSKK